MKKIIKLIEREIRNLGHCIIDSGFDGDMTEVARLEEKQWKLIFALRLVQEVRGDADVKDA